jgi:hypothetical protein
MRPDPLDPQTWRYFKPPIIAHDVGRSRDRSTAVIGGNSPFDPKLIGITELIELPQGLFGSPRASALAEVDRRYYSNAIIIADLSNDATYAEVLFETFGQRVIGLHISRGGDGMTFERRLVRNGTIAVYTIGRTHLLELFHSLLQSGQIRMSEEPMSRRAFEQLANLETEFRESGMVYTCPSGQHDDLGVSCAMLAWAAQHPHLQWWYANLLAARRPRHPRPKFNWTACT